MIKYAGPISSCILILKILLVYVYKIMDILEKSLMWGWHFFIFCNKNGNVHCTSITIICSEYFSM